MATHSERRCGRLLVTSGRWERTAGASPGRGRGRARYRLRYADFASAVAAQPPRLGPVRLVLVDGGTGSGKTLFAARFAAALAGPAGPVAVVHTDDLLDGWADQLTFWPRLVRSVLDPLSDGRPARHPVYDWRVGAFTGRREIPVPATLIVEGFGVVREAIVERCVAAVLLRVPVRLAAARALARDGVPALATRLALWQRVERRWYRATRPWPRVDLLVDGAPTIRHDPDKEFITIGEARAWTRQR